MECRGLPANRIKSAQRYIFCTFRASLKDAEPALIAGTTFRPLSFRKSLVSSCAFYSRCFTWINHRNIFSRIFHVLRKSLRVCLFLNCHQPSLHLSYTKSVSAFLLPIEMVCKIRSPSSSDPRDLRKYAALDLGCVLYMHSLYTCAQNSCDSLNNWTFLKWPFKSFGWPGPGWSHPFNTISKNTFSTWYSVFFFYFACMEPRYWMT